MKNNNVTGNTIQEDSNGDYQKVVLGIKDYNYYPNTITVKANQPVRIYLDESVGGCYRSFTVREFGVSKYLRSPEDYVEFVPTKTGTFGFNLQTNNIEVWNGSSWLTLPMKKI